MERQCCRYSARNHLDPQPSSLIPIVRYHFVKHSGAPFGSNGGDQSQLPKSKRKLLPPCNTKSAAKKNQIVSDTCQKGSCYWLLPPLVNGELRIRARMVTASRILPWRNAQRRSSQRSFGAISLGFKHRKSCRASSSEMSSTRLNAP